MSDEAKQAPQINFVSLVKRTIGKVLDNVGLEPTEQNMRMVATVLLNLGADYMRSAGETPEEAIALFKAFMTGTEEEQRAALKHFSELPFQKKDEPVIKIARD